MHGKVSEKGGRMSQKDYMRRDRDIRSFIFQQVRLNQMTHCHMTEHQGYSRASLFFFFKQNIQKGELGQTKCVRNIYFLLTIYHLKKTFINHPEHIV